MNSLLWKGFPMKVIITGASKGIGRGIATFLGREGFTVGLLARSQDLLEEVLDEIGKEGGKGAIQACDIRDPEETRVSILNLVDAMEGADALVNNAGLVIRKDVFSLSLDEWRAMVETNLNGLFYATRAILPHLKDQGSGHIINISSISGRLPLAGGSGYAATKFAVTGFSESLFLEVRGYGIKVTTLFPGSVDSSSQREGPDENAGWKVTSEEVGAACRDVLRTSPGNCISRLEIRPLKPPPK